MKLSEEMKMKKDKISGWQGKKILNEYIPKVEQLEKDNGYLMATLERLLEDAMYLYQYYPNNYRCPCEEYFGEIKKIVESRTKNK